MTNHVVGVTGGQFAHEGHGNEVDRQPGVTTRRRSTIKVEAKASPAADPNGQPRTPPFMCLRLLYLITIRLFAGGAGGARTHDRRIMRSTAPCTVRASCTDATEPCRRWR